MTRPSERGRFARVIASDLVAYFRAGSTFARSENDLRVHAIHGLGLLRARFGPDEALERYYADCLGSAFESLALTPPALAMLRGVVASLEIAPPAEERLSLVLGR